MNICYQVKFVFSVAILKESNFIPSKLFEEHPKLRELNVTKLESKHVITSSKLFYVWGQNKDEAKETAKKEFESFLNDNNLKLCSGYIMHTKEDYILDTTNGHNKELVNKINFLWARKRESFKPILKALYLRDQNEADDKGITFETDFDSFALDFMTNVCDNIDLSVIIDFIRYSETKENSQLIKVLFSNGWVEM